LSDNDIVFLKWDHNRGLVAACHGGRSGVHGQTRAVYRLLDELRARHSTVEIESCSSGAARAGAAPGADRRARRPADRALQRPHAAPEFPLCHGPAWSTRVLPGRVVAEVGLRQPILAPEQAWLVEFTSGRAHRACDR
jgi:Melibiase